MRARLDEIVRLTEDQTFSHAARMVAIRKEALAAIDELKEAQAKSGAKAGNTVPPANPAPAGEPAK